MSKYALLNLGLLLSFMGCYFEWGQGNHAFMYELVYELLRPKDSFWSSFAHPLVLGGLVGLLALCYAIYKKTPQRKITLIGIIALSPVVFMVLLAGALSANWKMVVSTLPFAALAIAYFFLRNRF